MNSTLSSSDSFHTPGTSIETPRSSNKRDNKDAKQNKNGMNVNGVRPENGHGENKKEPKVPSEDQSSKDINRRLVEYFVVVSSVPKVRKKKDAEKSPKQSNGEKRKPSNQQHQSSQAAARMDVRRAHLGRDFSGGSANAAGGSCATVETATVTTDNNDGQSLSNGSRPSQPRSPVRQTQTPTPTIATIGDALFGPPSPAERKSIASLQETDKMLSDQCLEIGESMFSEEKSTISTNSTQKMKKNFFRSINEQTKKIQANTAKMIEQAKQNQKDVAKMNSAGLQQLEKNLDKSLAKFKSMKLITPMASSAKEERVFQQEQKVDDQSSSSDDDSSFSLDSVTPGGNEPPSLNNLDGSIFRPSGNSTSSHQNSPVALSPTPPPPPTISVSSPMTDRPITPRISPLPDRHVTPRGPSENIRIGDQSESDCNGGYNDDIDDCILEPVITAQYPPVDHPDQPLNPMLPQFCHPQGLDALVPLHEFKMPTIHHFVLTDAHGGKLYGTCLTVYEEFTPHSEIEIRSGEDDELDHSREEGQERGYVECSVNSSPKVGRSLRRAKDHKYYAPRVLCLLSTWPYLSAFRTYLTQLYKMATMTNLMTAPLERYILNICAEVPAPPPGSFEVRMSILDSDIRFWAPPADQPIPYVSLPYGVLFECLDIGNVLFAWYTLACERKILLVSSQLSLLVVCAEILCSMIFPMRWSHLYIPCLPRFLTPMLDAPMPYLCGISREIFPHAVGDISDETVVVDLDRNVITMGRDTPDLPKLPHRRKTKLEAALEKNAGDVFWKARGLTSAKVEEARLSGDENMLAKMLGTADAVWDEQIGAVDEAFNLAHAPDSMSLLYSEDETPSERQSRWDAVQEAFLRFYVSMLKDYRKYMPSMATDKHSSWRGSDTFGGERFLAEEFVQSQHPDFQPFLEELIGTQQFDDFVTRRMYNAADAPDVKFFDQSIDAKRNRSKLRLKKKETAFLHSANAHRDLKQIDAIQPNRANIPPRSRFDTRYDMKKGLYTYPTWPESFDESLYGKPRPIPKIITAEFDRRSALTALLRARRGMADEGRQSGSSNPSAEATAFVLFFVTFSNTIGKEWTLLEKKHAVMGTNMLDQCSDASRDSSASDGHWAPKINPPWMAGESFESLHSNFNPSQKPDPTEVIASETDDEPEKRFCNPDCTNMWSLGNAIDPSAFIGNPWAGIGRPPDEGQADVECPKSPSEEELENEIEKARAIAKAQIDLGFNTLTMMRLRKLPTESITFKLLIQACGRCGLSHRAQQLMEMMTQDGMALDSEVYFAFIKAFSNAENESDHPFSRITDTASEFSATKSNPSVTSSSLSFLATSQGETEQSIKPSLRSSSKFMDEFHNAMSSTIAANRRAFKTAKMKRMKRLSRQNLTKKTKLCVTNAIKTHLELGYCILEDLYPGIKIDTDSDTCPKCSRVLDQDNIISGWKPCQVKDFSTMCPSCKYRFVPKFSVSCDSESFQGSQGIGTPLYCDYLSPWVLLREIRGLITTPAGAKAAKVLGVGSDDVDQVGIDRIIDPKFREGSGINATLWWNMIVTFTRFKIPYTFLLQGSYEDQQLIMPSMTDTM